MKDKSLDNLKEQIGKRGVEFAVAVNRTNIALAIVALGGTACLLAFRPGDGFVYIWILLTLFVAIVGVFFNMRLAAVLSKLLKTKVHWYEIPPPINRPRHFERWLEKKRAGS